MCSSDLLMGFVWSMFQNLNIWGVFWTNQIQMEQNTVDRWEVGGKLQVPSDPWLMLGVCSLSMQGVPLEIAYVGSVVWQ